MAQCEAEGRKHPTMDLYVGIFNSKLYTSNKGTSHGNAVDRWPRHAYKSSSENMETACDDAPTSHSVDARRPSHFRSKPPVLSALNSPSKTPASLASGGRSSRVIITSPIDMGHGGSENTSLISSDASSSKARGATGGGLPAVKGLQVNAGTDDGHLGEKNRFPVGHARFISNEDPAPKTIVAYSRYSKSGSSVEIADGVAERSAMTSFSHIEENHRNLQMGDSSKAAERYDGGTTVSKFQGLKVNRAGRHTTVEEEHIFPGQQSSGGIVNGDDYDNGKNFQADMHRNGLPNKNHEHVVSSAVSVLRSGEYNKDDRPGDRFAVRNLPSPDGTRSEPKNLTVTPLRPMTDVEGISHITSLPGNRMLDVVAENYLMNSHGTTEHDARALQSGRKDSIDYNNLQADKAITLVPKGNVHCKVGTNVTLEATTNNLVTKRRVKSSASTDSSSSHGGSSRSGSPTSAENCRDTSVSSFGNILFSKGSPRSASSRSIGSASFLGHNSIVPTKSSCMDSPASQFRYGTSSGRKSAELMPSRRYTEIVPNRKSSEMISSIHGRGSAMQEFEADSCGGSANIGKGTGSTGSNVSVGNGNLVFGCGDGNVKSVGGSIKSVSKQAKAGNQVNLVDNSLLKKVQASNDPEEVKTLGNEYYRRGQFSEALMLYTRAVTLSPSNPVYKSNRAAAFSATGQLGKAVKELEDAIRLQSTNARAHQQAASLYVRLGLLERARQHLATTAQQADILEVRRLRIIDEHISRCIEARRQCKWHIVIKESDAAVVAGADSAPHIFGYKSEALLGVHRVEEADGVCAVAQRVESSLVKLGVIKAEPFLLIVRVQVDMALGRFDGALEAAKSAAEIDPCNENVSVLLRKAQSVCKSRTTGNELFKAGRFFEALALYAEGLESDPMNAILLCNRAACRSKLGQWEKAAEDCNAALRVQPNYIKALMRRANCWTKLERWEDALQDYEVLRRRMPDDQEVARGLFDVQVAMKKLQGEDTRKMRFGGDVEEVVSDEQFQEAITSPGLSLVQFVTKWSERCQQLAPFVNELCKRNPSVNFMKVDVEERPYLAKLECVSFIPTFKIYRSGQKVKEILGPTEQSLEHALRHYST